MHQCPGALGHDMSCLCKYKLRMILTIQMPENAKTPNPAPEMYVASRENSIFASFMPAAGLPS
jgi:hypothetical protein